MKQIILAFAAMLPAIATAHADDIFSHLQFPGGAMESSRYGDAAPRSVIKKAPSKLNFSSSAAMGATAASGKISSRYSYGDAPLPSTIYNAPRRIDSFSAASMLPGSQPAPIGASPRILNGSN